MEQLFGICEWALPCQGSLAIRLASLAGFDGIQLGEAGGRRFSYPLNNPEVQKALAEAARQYHIQLHSLNLGALLSEGTMNYAPSTLKGEYARQSLRFGFLACQKLNIHTIVITASPTSEEAKEHILQHLQYACTLSDTCNIEIALESALPLHQIQEILLQLNERVKICMDTLNPLRFRTGIPQEQITTFGAELISHFHMKDSLSPLFTPSERGCVLLGSGDAGYSQSVDAIKSIGYQGWIISENYYYLPPMNIGQDFLMLAKKDLHTLKASFQ